MGAIAMSKAGSDLNRPATSSAYARLHPTYRRRPPREARRPQVAQGIAEGDTVAADALRDLIDTVIVTAAADRTVTVEINGHLARLVGHDPFSEGGAMVAEEGLEPPTQGL